jgi:hypothetical protein
MRAGRRSSCHIGGSSLIAPDDLRQRLDPDAFSGLVFNLMKILPLFACFLVSSAFAGEPVSLFDGKTFSGWTGQEGKAPGPGWKIADGVLHLDGAGGNLFSEKEYSNFDLEWEWKIAEAGNNGVKYWVTKVGGKEWLGIEYQMLDDAKHPDGKNGEKRLTASFYDIQAPGVKTPVNPPGEWNKSRIVAKEGKLQHWINGVLVGEADTNSADWKAKVAESKFKGREGFAPGKGKIMITDHKDKVWYRNIRITEL